MLALWQLYTVGVPGPSLCCRRRPRSPSELWGQRPLLLDNTWVTVEEILIGFGLAIVLGVLLAMLIRSSRTIERALYPWLVVSQRVPVPAVAPIFVIWTGFDLRPKIMVIALVGFFPIAVNTIDGLRAADPQLLRLMKTLRRSRWQRFRYAQLPASLPFLFSGLKVAAALSTVIGAVFGEWVGASEGLGYLILVLNNATDTTTMFATIFLLSDDRHLPVPRRLCSSGCCCPGTTTPATTRPSPSPPPTRSRSEHGLVSAAAAPVLIRGAWVLLMAPGADPIRDGALLMGSAGEIAAVGPARGAGGSQTPTSKWSATATASSCRGWSTPTPT